MLPSSRQGVSVENHESSDDRSPAHTDTLFAPLTLSMLAVYPKGFWGLWLRLTSPPKVTGPSAILMRDQMRRSHLLSALQLATLALLLLLLPRSFLPATDMGIASSVSTAVLVVLVSLLCNRLGHITAAALLYVTGLTVAVMLARLFAHGGQLALEDLPAFDLFAVPILLSGILLPRRSPIVLWAICTLFLFLDLAFAEHQANLATYLAHTSVPWLAFYPIAIIPLALMTITAVVAWLAADIVAQAVGEADRKVELERAYLLIAYQKRRLEDGIKVIQDIHAQVANGDLNARAPTNSGDILLPLAVTLNLMLERLARTSSAAQALNDLEQCIQRLSQAVIALAQGQLQTPIPRYGMGRLTPLATNLEQLRQGIIQITSYSSATAEQIGNTSTTVMAAVQALAREPSSARSIERLQRAALELEKLSGALRQYLARFA